MSYRENFIHLRDVCEIQSGFTARSAVAADKFGGLPALQLGDLKGLGEINVSEAPLYDVEGKNLDRYSVGPGDVLFRSRGTDTTAAIVTGGKEAFAIAMLPLVIIRPNHELVLPEFVAWLINQSESQKYFSKRARGTNLKMIPRDALAELRVYTPEIDVQSQVVEASRLARIEASLLRQLAEKKEEFTSFALLRQLRNAQPRKSEAGHPVARLSSKRAGQTQRTNS